MIGVKKHKFSLMVSTPSELKQIITHMIFFKTVTWNNFCAIFGQIRKLFMKLTAEKKHFWNFWLVFPQQIWPTTQYYYTRLRKSPSLTFLLSKRIFPMNLCETLSILIPRKNRRFHFLPTGGFLSYTGVRVYCTYAVYCKTEKDYATIYSRRLSKAIQCILKLKLKQLGPMRGPPFTHP